MQKRRGRRRRSKKNSTDKINADGNRARDNRMRNGGDSVSSGQEAARAKFQELHDQARSNARKEIELRNRMEAALAQFVSTEVDLALTFCEMASSSRDSDTAQRRISRAVEAHESAAHYLQQLDVSEVVKIGISEKLATLEESLDRVHREKVENAGFKPLLHGTSSW